MLVDTQNPAAALFARVGFVVGVAHNGVLGVAGFTPFDQLGVFVHDDEGMLDRDCGHLDAQHLGGALRMVARCSHNVFGRDDDLLVGWDKVAALFDHLGAGDFPMGTVPVEGISLHFADDIHAALACALGHGLRDVRGVNIAVLGVIDRTFQIAGFNQRPALFDLIRGQPFVFDVTCLGR